MIFTSLTFLAFFIVLLGLIVIIRGNTQREYLLLLASYVFYGAWHPVYILLIIASSVWGWYLGLLMYKTDNRALRKRYVWLSLFLSLSMLAYFKYTNFFIENLSYLFGIKWHHIDIVLPVGISFFTFQTMSYTIDLYRERIPVCTSLHKFMLFVAFFPQLVAGPIVRASEFLPQLDKDIRLKWQDILIGSQIFLGGAIQKVLIADNMSIFVDPVFSNPGLYSAGTLWLSTIAYGIQIFCDFSGYSLMAIGVARILGFELPKNFNMPYLATSITDFWRRWHMTLSFWLRDYLYIPLGGNRYGTGRTYLNLIITMLLGGLWHGASWNFVIWGGMHGAALALHKLWTEHSVQWKSLKQLKVYKFFSWLITITLVGMLWIPFRSKDFPATISYYNGLVPNHDGVIWQHPNVIIIVICFVVWHLMHMFGNKLLMTFPHSRPQETVPILVIGLFLMLILLFAPINTSPFIYFQF